jgi:hypothetical protein
MQLGTTCKLFPNQETRFWTLEPNRADFEINQYFQHQLPKGGILKRSIWELFQIDVGRRHAFQRLARRVVDSMQVQILMK